MMKNILQITIVLVLFLTIPACNKSIAPTNGSTTADGYTGARPQNVILMIGDGMGITQITAGLYSNENKLNLELFPIVGLHKSYSSNKLITDSAAGATAFACGVKTYNGAIGVDKNKKPVKTLLEMAEEKEMSTGMVATSTIVHATPASFIAHVESRKMYEEIAADFLKTDIDLFIGGGKKYFDQRENDDRNLYNELRDKGYLVGDYFNGPLNELKINETDKFAYFTANDQPLPVSNGRDYLPYSSKLAVDWLDKKSDKGFFLMIEGSQIDWGGHANESDYIIQEMIDFDNTIGKVLNFARKDKNTLIVITADHECGGYAINPGSEMGKIKGAFTTDYHTAALIPVFAYGPGAELFSGVYENTAIFEKLKLLMEMP